MMKLWTLCLVILTYSQITFSAEVEGQARARKTDVAIVGPGGEVLIYYKDGNNVVVRNCGDGYKVIKERSDCVAVGQENRVPLDVFKRVLKSQFLIGDSDKLKPMTEEELKAYRSTADKNPDQLKAREKELDAKLARIQDFIQNYGSDDRSKKDLADTQKLLADVRRDLDSTAPKEAAIKKVNAMIDEIVDKKIASSTVIPVSFAKAGDQAIYTVLKQFDASKGECGTDEILNGTPGKNPNDHIPTTADDAAYLENFFVHPVWAADSKGITVDSRIRDCSPLPNSAKTTKAGVSWNLVARKRDASTGKFYEVWKDSKSGLLWGDRLDSTYTHYNAVAMAANGKVDMEKACATDQDEAKRANAGLIKTSGKSFGLPSIEEFQQSEKNGIREVLPNMGNWYWSASLNPNYSDFARVFVGFFGYSDYFSRGVDYFSVRCVGR